MLSPNRYLLSLLLLSAPLIARAADPAPQSSRPALSQLDRDIQSLYQQSATVVVRVQMPPPHWIAEMAVQQNPLNHWGQELDPKVRENLQAAIDQAKQGKYPRIQANLDPTSRPATAPADQPAAWRVTVSQDDNTVTLQSPGDPNGQIILLTPTPVTDAAGAPHLAGPLRIDAQPSQGILANSVGIIIDSDGHLLVPMYVEKEAAQRPIPVLAADGKILAGAFVGSDRQTNLTLLKIDVPKIHGAQFAPRRPADGSIVLLFAPTAAATRLALWTGGDQDNGVVINTDGQVCGFSRFGQFLRAASVAPVTAELLQHGAVRRATLGAWIREIRPADPIRQQLPALASQPALQVLEVTPNSLAAAAGLHKGDLILSLADQPVGDIPTFAATMAGRSGKTPLKILRDNTESTLTLDLQLPEN